MIALPPSPGRETREEGSMAERAAKLPKCPECGGDRVDALNSDERYRRFQCGNPKCLHGWSEAKEPDLEAAKERHRLFTTSEEEIVGMSKGTEICAKGCGRDDLKPGPGKSAHERHCDGKARPQDEKPAKQKRSTPPRGQGGSAPAPAPGGLIPVISEVPEHLAGTAVGETLQLLITRREFLRDEASKVDGAIVTIVHQASPATAQAEPLFRKVK